MNAHELARQLLEGPDAPVITCDGASNLPLLVIGSQVTTFNAAPGRELKHGGLMRIFPPEVAEHGQLVELVRKAR